MSKNAKQLFKENKFGIRKFTVGVASVIIGTSFYLGAENQAQAAESNQTEMSSSQESSGVNSGNNENVETDQSTTEETNVAEQSNVENTTNNTESTTNILDNESVNTNEDTSVKSVDSNETSKTDETNNNTEELTNNSNVETNIDTNVSDKQVDEKTDDTTTTPKEDSTEQQPSVDTNETENNTSETNTVESKTEQTKPSTNNTEDRTTAGDNSKQDQSVNNNVEKETPKEESTTNNVENHTSVDDKSESNQSVNNSVEKETTENKEEKSNDTANNNSTNETENKVDSTNNNKEEIAPKEDKSTSQSETTENNTKEESKSEEVKTSSDESNKEDNKTVNDVETNSNEISNNNTNEPVKPSVDVENNTDTPVQPEADSQISDASELNSITSPFVSLNALETAGSQPTDNPTDVANSALSQPVTAARTTNQADTTNNVGSKLKIDTLQKNLLSSDKYTITNLTGEYVEGDDFTKPTYQTHMTLKLDDSVKGGDKIQYGLKYDYLDNNGDYYRRYFKTTPFIQDGKTVSTLPIVFDGVEIGVMEPSSVAYRTGKDNYYNPDYSLDTVNNKENIDKKIPYEDYSQPITITFNENINNLKNVEISLDNVFALNNSNSHLYNISSNNEFYKSSDMTVSNTYEKNGSTFISIPNSFILNGDEQDLNLDLKLKNYDDSIRSSNNHWTDNGLSYTTNYSRKYVKTKTGEEYITTNPNLSVRLSARPNKEPLNEITVTQTVPKELTELVEFKVNNMVDPKIVEEYANSKLNPLKNVEGVYANTRKDIKLTDSNVEWIKTYDKTVNDNGDTVYTFNWKTKDGSYVKIAPETIDYLEYHAKDPSTLETTPLESYDEANARPYGEKWGVPEWDALLAEHPLTSKITTVHENGINEKTLEHNKEAYSIYIENVQTAPSGAIRVLADNEKLETEPHKEVDPYKTETIVDPRLGKDDRIVDVEGINGEHTWDEEILYRNGDEVSRTIKNDKTVKRQDEVVRIGVDNPIADAPPVNSDTENTESIPYETHREFDPNMTPNSDDVVTQEGKDGVKHIETRFVDGINYTQINEYNTNHPDENRSYEDTLKLVQDEYKQVLTDKYGDKLQIVKDFTYNPETKQYEIEYIVDDEDRVITDKQDEIIKFAPVEFDYESKTEYTNKLPKGERKVDREGVKGLKNPDTGDVIKDKVDELILIGTGIEGIKEDTITKEIPFDTNYIFDETKPAGYKETITEGQKGIETTTVTQNTLDGEPVGEPTYSDPVTTQDKIDKEVVIGTGVVGKNTTVEDITIEYETEIRKRDDLPVGTRNVIQRGQVGIDRITVIQYTLNGKTDPTKTDEVSTEHIQDKIDEIVEVGTAVEGTRTETKDVFVDYGYEEIEDSSLPKGETKIVQQGEKGIDRITTTYPTLNGEDSGEGVPSTEHIKDPVKEIVRIGTGVVGENKSTTTKTIPFETETIKLDSVPEGETRVAREGENGIRTITTITPTLNGEVNGDSKEIPVVTKQPVNKIVVVGTGKETTETSHYDTEVKFDKEIIYDDNLKKGETETRQTGKNGIDRTTVTTHYLNGKQYGDQETTTDRITDPINEIIAVGTAVEVQDRTVVQNEVDFETEYVDTKDLKAGETRIKQAGQKGIDTTTTVRTLLNDEVINTDTNTVRTKDPVTQIIERGIGEVGSTTSDTKYEIPYGYDERYDDTLEQGKREVLKKGETGLDIIKVTRPTLNGEIDETGDVTVEKVHVKDPVDEIVRIGTGVKGTNTKERIEEVDFETEYVDNNQLPKGEERIKVQGEVGFDKIITTENTLNGKVVDSSDDKTRLKDPVTQIIERGTGIVDVKTETSTVKVPFDEKEVLDKTLKQGERVIDVLGEDGIDTIITTTPTLNGNVNGDSKTRVEHTKIPKTQIVRVGAGVEGQNKVTETIPVPFETKYIDDENLPKGKEIVDVNGIDGVDKTTTIIPTFNGEELTDQAKSSTEHVKAPTNRVIRRGTGIEDVRTETKTEPLKYGTDKVFDQDLPEGYKEVIRDGVDGEITTTITTPTLNGKDNGPSDESKAITKKPVSEIVKIGTGKLTTKTSKSKTYNNFKIIYKESDELEIGQTKVVRDGQNGIIETITKQDYVNGKTYGEPDVTTNEIQTVIDEIVLIGTKEPLNPVKPLDPDNNNYDPKGNDITKDKGHKTTPKEITDQVLIPKYPSDKGTPVKTVKDETLIPDGNTTGDYTVPVIVTYPDGSKDYVGVVVHIIDTNDNESIVEKVIDKDTGKIVKSNNLNNEPTSTSNTKYVIDNNSSEQTDNEGHIGIQMNKQHNGHTKYIIDEKPVQKDASIKENNVTNQTNTEKVDQLPETGDNQQSKTVTLGLITMVIGAALTFARRRKQKEDK